MNESNCIINWELYLELMEKKYGKNKIEKNYRDFKKPIKVNGNFHTNEIVFFTDGETVSLESYLKDRKKYFYNRKSNSFHYEYPTSKDNIVNDSELIICLVKSLYEYVEKKEVELNKYKEVLKEFLSI